MKNRLWAMTGTALALLATPAFAALVPLSSINNPPLTIGNANVRDTSGRVIGAVQRVDLTTQGAPAKVSVALLGPDEKVTVLDAGRVAYDASRNEIITDSSRGQLHMLYGQN
jgi:hypothetical protein